MRDEYVRLCLAMFNKRIERRYNLEDLPLAAIFDILKSAEALKMRNEAFQKVLDKYPNLP